MGRLHELFDTQGQSPWLDNLRRGWITSGELARWVDEGVRGLTSNPAIFQNAIAGSDDYDEQFRSLIRAGENGKEAHDIEAAYWDLVTTDIVGALEVLEPVYRTSDGVDGYVSVEVDPALARDTEGTISAARDLHEAIDAPNLYVKIPGTVAGLGAIEQMIAEGRSINVTLLFSLERYDEVIEAYLSGLERCDGDLSRVSSVASFFISRVDTEVDRELDRIGTDEALALKGRAAIAQGRLAYALFRERFSGPRWESLAGRGARVQRPLWASTSTKNPDYPDTSYVDSLIGPDTVNTIPDATLEAFVDHGSVARTVDIEPEQDRAVIAGLEAVGVDMAAVARRLEDEGVSAFVKSFDDLIETLRSKAEALH